MTPASDRREFALDLSREERWLLHHVLLDRVESELADPTEADPPPIVVYRAFDKLETGSSRFSMRELRCLRAELRRYVEATGTPKRDRSIANDLLRRLHRTAPTVAAVELAS